MTEMALLNIWNQILIVKRSKFTIYHLILHIFTQTELTNQ